MPTEISRSFDGNFHTGSFQENQEWKLPNHSYWGTWAGVATVSACLSVGMPISFFVSLTLSFLFLCTGLNVYACGGVWE